jgi:hypothetical protein
MRRLRECDADPRPGGRAQTGGRCLCIATVLEMVRGVGEAGGDERVDDCQNEDGCGDRVERISVDPGCELVKESLGRAGVVGERKWERSVVVWLEHQGNKQQAGCVMNCAANRIPWSRSQRVAARPSSFLQRQFRCTLGLRVTRASIRDAASGPARSCDWERSHVSADAVHPALATKDRAVAFPPLPTR